MKALTTGVSALVFALILAVHAGSASAIDCCCQNGLCSEKCATCCLKCGCEDEKKKCFCYETKKICIPRVVFPWQKKCNPCANNGATVRVVKVLTSKEYKCKVRTFEWTPHMICGCCTKKKCSCGPSCLLGQSSRQPGEAADAVPDVHVAELGAPVDVNDTEQLLEMKRKLAERSGAIQLVPVSVTTSR